MNGLVGYGSSDEDDEINERPAKIAKTEANSESRSAKTPDATLPTLTPNDDPLTAATQPDLTTLALPPGSTAPSAPYEALTPYSAPSSPYTATRTLIHNLTMPTHPNFDIPRSPSPPTAPDGQADLAASTKKLVRFLDLKTKCVHFNARLNSSSSLRNPSLLPKLMEFVGLSEDDSRMTTLGDDSGGVPVRWRENCYVEGLVRENERWRKKKRRAQGGRVDFVSEKGAGGGSASASATGSGKGTPVAPSAEGTTGSKESQKSRFDQQ